MPLQTRDPVPAHHGWAPPGREPLCGPANAVTAVRTVAAVALAVTALGTHRVGLLLASLAVYWIGDILDGEVARRTGCETRTGAVLDILCDRLCVALFYAGWVAQSPGDALPVAVFLAQFMVVDALLSLAFLAWPLRSPNYFFLVDRRVFALNWSRPAKATNSAALALTLLLTDGWLLPTALAVAVLAVKLWSLVLVQRLDPPGFA